MRHYIYIFLSVCLLMLIVSAQTGVTPTSNAKVELDTVQVLSLTQTISTTLTQPDEPVFDIYIYLPLILKNYDPTESRHSLTINKTASSSAIQAGELLTYTLQYGVVGNELAPGLTLEDTLPVSTTYQSCSGGLSCSESGGVVAWNLGDVDSNTDEEATVVVQVETTVMTDTLLENSATLMDATGLSVTDTTSTVVGEITNDIVLVFDTSGSMQFDTICHGCYEPYGEGDVAWQDLKGNDPNYDAGNPIFPNPAYIRPVMSDHLPTLPAATGGVAGVGQNLGRVCGGRDGNPTGYYQVVSGANESYIIMEAELYTRKLNSFYQSEFRTPGQGFWAVQHTNYRTIYRMEDEQVGLVPNPYATDLDRTYEVGATPIQLSYPTGSWVSHQPYLSWAINPDPNANPSVEGVPFGKDYSLLDAQSNTSPSLEYNFVTSPDWADNGGLTRIFVRMQGAGETFGFADLNAEGLGKVYWTILNQDKSPLLADIYESPKAMPGSNYGGADKDKWSWLELTATSPTLPILESNKTYILKIWAGGVGGDLDRIVIGNGAAPQARELTLPPTSGSAFGEACNRCNPIYGQTIGSFDECDLPSDNGYVIPESLDMTQDELYSGYQPLRNAKEAAKSFVKKLNPYLDQIGFVPYNTTTIEDGIMELQCVRYGQEHGEACFDDTNPISYTRVLDVIERVPSIGSTNIGAGLRDGLQVLGVDIEGLGTSFDNNCSLGTEGDPLPGSHCGRSGTNRILVVMTDGVPTNSPSGCGSGSGYTKHRSCAINYTQKAADNGVTVYTIGLGNGVDGDLLSEMADIGEGQYFSAATSSGLDAAFDEILAMLP